ncbi:MAG: stage III sporulation protein AA [Sulfobacillus acidophilus]|uniref:Stage III sporulation protein AA n=1 Tax=Sulfobacillus acidophilus TaxID=53633 RepID=A0A2T2WPJ9_9FIRM|nr:MAG: stage III sporulation protein AA [Sulfobacillus acidophilus]
MEPWHYLPEPWRQALRELPRDLSATVEEVRFRVGRQVFLYGADWIRPLSHALIPDRVSFGELDRILGALVEHSLYARMEELRQGYITLPGGHRVGVVGRAVLKEGRIETMREISGLNLRIGRPIEGPGQQLTERVQDLTAGGSWLLVSPPRAGKTTLLRDLVRYRSNQGKRVVVVDERSEIAGFGGAGVFGHDLGYHTDVLDGWPKVEGVEVALRTLGPEIIAIDELGGRTDLDAVLRARYAGVEVLATVHARTISDLFQRPPWRRALRQRVFDAVIFLTVLPMVGTVDHVWVPPSIR